MVWNADERLIAMIWSHFSTGNSSIGATCWMPALLTSTSREPNVLRRCTHHLGDLGRLGHVGGRIERLDAEFLLDAAALLFDRGLVAEAVDGDVGALGGEARGQRPSRCRRSSRSRAPSFLSACRSPKFARRLDRKRGFSPDCPAKRRQCGRLLAAAQHKKRPGRHVFAIPAEPLQCCRLKPEALRARRA